MTPNAASIGINCARNSTRPQVANLAVMCQLKLFGGGRARYAPA